MCSSNHKQNELNMLTTQQDLLIAQNKIISITQKLEKLCGTRFNFRGNSCTICTEAVCMFFETDKGKIIFQYRHPVVFINQCLNLLSDQTQLLEHYTTHSTSIYNMFRPFWPSSCRF